MASATRFAIGIYSVSQNIGSFDSTTTWSLERRAQTAASMSMP